MGKRKHDMIKGMRENIGLAAMEGVGYSIPFHIAGSMTGDSAVVATRVATVGSSLAGQATLIHGTSNLIKGLDAFDMKERRRRR
jgi:hypothetical protein